MMAMGREVDKSINIEEAMQQDSERLDSKLTLRVMTWQLTKGGTLHQKMK